MGKGLSNKYSQKLLDSAKKSITDAIKTASKRAIKKTVKATGDLIENKIADIITRVSKTSPQNNSEILINLCNYSDAYILVKGSITVPNIAAAVTIVNNSKYSDAHSKTSGSLWQDYWDESALDANKNISNLFKFKHQKTENQGSEAQKMLK